MNKTETFIFAGLFILIIGLVLFFVSGIPISKTIIKPIPNLTSPNITPLKPSKIPENKTQKWETNPKYCESDEDCVVTILSCCPCNMGGKPVCVNKHYAEKFKKNLSCKMLVCPAVYLCDEVTACACVNHTCVPA